MISKKAQKISLDKYRLDDIFKYLIRELLGLDKALRTIRGSIQLDQAKKVQLEQHIIAKENSKPKEIENDQSYTESAT